MAHYEHLGTGWGKVTVQIYTKILIGMAVGVLIGVFAGPKSSFMDRDVYRLGGGAELVTAGNSDCLSDTEEKQRKTPYAGCRVTLTLPSGVSMDLIRESIDKVSILDEQGVGHEVESVVNGRIKVSEKLLLKATGPLKGRLSAMRLKSGDTLTVSYKLRALILPNEVRALPEPISGLGDMITSTIKPVGTLFLGKACRPV